MSEYKDYDTLEWFDCKNNFPPMSIDLYVDSEHGYGIGRLGRRVKDKSIIWTVHLDSGENYLVYAFYKVKRWAYMTRNSRQIQPSTERRLPMPCNGKKSGGKKPPKK